MESGESFAPGKGKAHTDLGNHKRSRLTGLFALGDVIVQSDDELETIL
jgi:hypothetical protein